MVLLLVFCVCDSSIADEHAKNIDAHTFQIPSTLFPKPQHQKISNRSEFVKKISSIIEAGNLDRARKNIDDALYSINISDIVDAISVLSFAYAKKGQLDQALELVSILEDNSYINSRLGWYDNDKPKNTISLIGDWAKNKEGLGDLANFVGLGRAYYKNGNIEKAKELILALDVVIPPNHKSTIKKNNALKDLISGQPVDEKYDYKSNTSITGVFFFEDKDLINIAQDALKNNDVVVAEQAVKYINNSLEKAILVIRIANIYAKSQNETKIKTYLGEIKNIERLADKGKMFDYLRMPKERLSAKASILNQLSKYYLLSGDQDNAERLLNSAANVYFPEHAKLKRRYISSCFFSEESLRKYYPIEDIIDNYFVQKLYPDLFIKLALLEQKDALELLWKRIISDASKGDFQAVDTLWDFMREQDGIYIDGENLLDLANAVSKHPEHREEASEFLELSKAAYIKREEVRETEMAKVLKVEATIKGDEDYPNIAFYRGQHHDERHELLKIAYNFSRKSGYKKEAREYLEHSIKRFQKNRRFLPSHILAKIEMVRALIEGRHALSEDILQVILLHAGTSSSKNEAYTYMLKVRGLVGASTAFRNWGFEKEAEQTLKFARQVADSITGPMTRYEKEDDVRRYSSKSYFLLARTHSKYKNYEEAIDLYDAVVNLSNRGRVEGTERSIYLRKEQLLADISFFASDEDNSALLLQVTQRITHPFYKSLVMSLNENITKKDKLGFSDIVLYVHSREEISSIRPYLFWLVTQRVNNGALAKAEETLGFISQIANSFPFDSAVALPQSEILWAYYYAHIGDMAQSRNHLDEASKYVQKVPDEYKAIISSIISSK